jgi:hypothetical protein
LAPVEVPPSSRAARRAAPQVSATVVVVTAIDR